MSDSLGARMAHCVVEESVKDIFNDIDVCSGDRAILDNKALRVDKLRTNIVDQFCNNPQWEFVKLFTFVKARDGPAGVDLIDPSIRPADDHKISGFEFQGKFNLVKTYYTVVLNKWMASGQSEEVVMTYIR